MQAVVCDLIIVAVTLFPQFLSSSPIRIPSSRLHQIRRVSGVFICVFSYRMKSTVGYWSTCTARGSFYFFLLIFFYWIFQELKKTEYFLRLNFNREVALQGWLLCLSYLAFLKYLISEKQWAGLVAVLSFCSSSAVHISILMGNKGIMSIIWITCGESNVMGKLTTFISYRRKEWI